MSMNKKAATIFAAMNAKGFWPENPADRNVGEALMLMNSELAEALEADRKNKHVRRGHPLQALALIGTEEEIDGMKFQEFFKTNVKDTFEDELADCIIRILDYCGGMNIDIESHVETKMAYNASRAHKHGKEY